MDKLQLASLPNASLLRRVIAGVYDLFLLFAVAFLYTMVVILIANSFGVQPEGLILEAEGEQMTLIATADYHPMLEGPLYKLGLYFSLVLFYVGFWRSRSATLGMQTWRTQLINEDGSRPTWKQLWIRAFAGTISVATLGLGFLYSLVDKQNRTLHDLLSKTRVVVYPKGSK